ncbi:unnamed protein product [Alternaria alternata]
MGERPESRSVWRSELRKQESSLSDTRRLVLQFYDDWEDQNSQEFVNNYRLEGTRESEPKINFFKQAFDEATRYLHTYFDVGDTSLDFGETLIIRKERYISLIRSHVSINAHSVEQAEENIKNNVVWEKDSLPDNLDPILMQRAYIYAKNVPRFVEEMEKSSWYDPKENISFEDVWWILMMRLHAWTMSVDWVDDRGGVKIPSEYYDSPTRVYIL